MHKRLKKCALTLILVGMLMCSSLLPPSSSLVTVVSAREKEKRTPTNQTSGSRWVPVISLESGESFEIDGPYIKSKNGREITYSFSIYVSYGAHPILQGGGRQYLGGNIRIYSYQIDFGDGSPIYEYKYHYVKLSARVEGNHTYPRDGVYLLRVCAYIDVGGSLAWTDWKSTIVNIGKYKTKTITIDYTFDEPIYEKVPAPVYPTPEVPWFHFANATRIHIPGCDRIERFLQPVAPSKLFKILLPPHATVKEIRVTPKETRELEGIGSLGGIALGFGTYGLIGYPNRFFTSVGNGLGVVSSIVDPLSMSDRAFLTNAFMNNIGINLGGLSSSYSHDGESITATSYVLQYKFPDSLYEDFGTQYKRGFPIRLIYLHPIQYKVTWNNGWSLNKIYFYKKMKIEIVLEEDDSELHPLYRGLNRDFDAVAEIIDNPEVLDLYRSLPKPKGVEDGKPKMLIITPIDLSQPTIKGWTNGLQELIDAHMRYQGIECKVEVAHTIGRDREGIRGYIRSQYMQGVDYVLLLSDDNYDWLDEEWRGARLSDSIGKVVTFPNHLLTSIPTYQVPAYFEIFTMPAITGINCSGMLRLNKSIKINRTKSQGETPTGGFNLYIGENGDLSIEPQYAPLKIVPSLSDVPIPQYIPSDATNSFTDFNSLLDFSSPSLFDVLSNMSPIELLTEEGETIYVNPISVEEDGRIKAEILEGESSQDIPSPDNQCEQCDTNNIEGNYTISASATIPKKVICYLNITIFYFGIPITTSSDYPYACLDDFAYSYKSPSFYYLGQASNPSTKKKVESYVLKAVDELPFPKDLFAEVYVGRAPLDNVEELQNFVSKTVSYLKYQSDKTDKELSKMLMIGEYLGFYGEEDFGFYSMKELIDGSNKHHYATTGIPSDKCKITMVLNDEDRLWPYGIPKEVPAKYLFNHVNLNGYDLTNHLGHSCQLRTIQLYSQFYLDYAAYALGIKEKNKKKLKKLFEPIFKDYEPYFDLFNYVQFLENFEKGEPLSATNKPFILYSQGCLAGAFDWPDYHPMEYFTRGSGSPNMIYPSGNDVMQGDAVGEGLLEIESGAAATIQNTLYGFGNLLSTDAPSQAYHREFIDAIFGEGKTTIGQALQDAREDNIIRLERELPYRILQYGIALLGDPALEIKNSKSAETIDSRPVISIDIKQSNEFGEGPVFQERGICIDAVVNLEESPTSQQSVVIDEIALDYDQDLIEVTNVVGKMEGSSTIIKGENDGDSIRWRNVKFDKTGSSFSNFAIHIEGKVKKHVISFSRIYTIESVLYVIQDGKVQKKSVSTVVHPRHDDLLWVGWMPPRMNYSIPDHLPSGLTIEKKVKKVNEDEYSWRDTLSAKVGEKINVRIEISNTGENITNGTADFIIGLMTDFLPKGLKYVGKSGKLTASVPRIKEVKEVTQPITGNKLKIGILDIDLQAGKVNNWTIKTIRLEPDFVMNGIEYRGWEGDILYKDECGSLPYHQIKDMYWGIPNNLMIFYQDEDISTIALPSNPDTQARIRPNYISPDRPNVIFEYTVEVTDSGDLNIDGTVSARHKASSSSLIVDRRITINVVPEPLLSCNTQYYDFGSVKKGETKSAYIQIWNGNEGSKLQYTIIPQYSWVTVYPSSGVSLGEYDTITVTIDTTDLSTGEHRCNLNIESNGGDGVIQLRMNVVDPDSVNPPNNNPPTPGSLVVKLLKPVAGLYVRDKLLLKLKRLPIVVGQITIQADITTYDSSVQRVEFIIGDEVKNVTYAAPYQYTLNERMVGIKKIKVVAYDSEDRKYEDEIKALIINLGRS